MSFLDFELSNMHTQQIYIILFHSQNGKKSQMIFDLTTSWEGDIK
jgi:hypothetical protein